MIKQLREIPILNQLSEETLVEISNNITIKDYRADEVVFSEGETSRYIYLVVSGKVKITKLCSTGREIILHIIRENEMFGEQALFKEGENPKSAKTIEKSLLFQIRLEVFKKILEKDHKCALMLLEIMNLKLRQAHRQIIKLPCKDT